MTLPCTLADDSAESSAGEVSHRQRDSEMSLRPLPVIVPVLHLLISVWISPRSTTAGVPVVPMVPVRTAKVIYQTTPGRLLSERWERWAHRPLDVPVRATPVVELSPRLVLRAEEPSLEPPPRITLRRCLGILSD